MTRVGRTLAETIAAIRSSRRAVPDLFPDYERDTVALATDRRFKRWLSAAGWLGFDLTLLAALSGTDKFGVHNYTPVYEALMGSFRRRPVSLLELGVGGYERHGGGESLLMWAAYFPNGRIYGVDIHDKTQFSRGRIKVFQCSQTDRQRLTELSREIGPFDFVIDDGSHISADQIESFRILWPFVKPGGSYVVEDVGTSYAPAYGGGPHGSPAYQHSCVSYFKSLVDSVNVPEHQPPPDASIERSIRHMAFHRNMIVVTKRS